ncbi:hypothetical protein SNR37_002666 [Agarivorans aestuarii]|uniref:Uncharacterized protein n=1 Tax=Agarivorans aestuarii TaxID=1563703 RepID=A0ABU7G1G7_9ALTE|nr:hypothetical protein [Agarivorans aestuarii]MEE1673252.1 hypothetical protein [Agarivorans aestuarii]
MALGIFINKWTWVTISSAALIVAGFLLYFVSFGPVTAQEARDNKAIKDFGQCLTIRVFSKNLRACDRFYLEYLPNKTDPIFKEDIVDVEKLEPQQIVSTYRDVNRLLVDHGLEPYPELSLLSHGQLVDYIR